MKKLRALIFDFDGVIAESTDIKKDAFAFLFRAYPKETVDRVVSYHMQHGGISRFKKFDYIYREILNKKLTPQGKNKLGKQFAGFVYKKVVSCDYVKGAYEFLKKFHVDFKLFIVSGTPEKEIRAIVKKRRLDDFFVEVLGAPQSKVLLNKNILSKYGFKPGEVIYVGDSQDDYYGAVKNKIKFIARITDTNNGFFKGLKIYGRIKDFFELRLWLMARKYV